MGRSRGLRAGSLLTKRRWTIATNGGALNNEPSKLIEDSNESWVVAGASKIHRGPEVSGEFGVAEGTKGATDVGLDAIHTGFAGGLVDKVSDVGMRGGFGVPVGA